MSSLPIDAPSIDLAAEVEALGRSLSLVRGRIGEVIFGQREVVEQALIALLCGGHALLIGVPGLAKTRLVETLGAILGLDEKRIQCTPDLMPADILGSEVLEESETGRRSFRFIQGPVFCQLLMADEINRASPRTQSALLQAMQEGRVSIAGQYHALPRPFHVLATQNPLEQEGTYPLPEAQLDRFLLQIDVDYPDLDAERQMLIATTGTLEDRPRPAMNGAEVIAAQRLVRRLPIGESVVEAILALVRSARPDAAAAAEMRRLVSWGPGPRASQALMLACRARALIDGRFSPSIDDVVALAPAVLRHRMAVSFAGRAEGVTVARIIEQILAPFRVISAASQPRALLPQRRPARPAALRDRAEAAAARLPPLLIAAERVAVTVAQGVHGRRRVGQGETFWQFRQYQAGDAAVAIDWRESAKSQRFYVRETEWEAAQSVWLWRDASASMEYSSADYVAEAAWPTKRDRAELLLVALASLLVRGGERLSLLGSGIAPMSGRLALSRVAETISRDANGEASLPAFAALPRAAQLVLIGDFLSPLDEVNTLLTRFAVSGIKGHLLQIVDPAEEDLPFTGRIRFTGTEERDEIVVSRVESIRGEYAQRFRQHRDGLAAIAASLGWTFGSHRTDRPPELALLALYGTLSADRRR